MTNFDIKGIIERNDYSEMMETFKEMQSLAKNPRYWDKDKLPNFVGQELWATEYSLDGTNDYFYPEIDCPPVLTYIDEAAIEAVAEVYRTIGPYNCTSDVRKALKSHIKRNYGNGRWVKKGVTMIYADHRATMLFDDEQLAWQYYILSKQIEFRNQLVRRDRINDEEKSINKLIDEFA